jgi:Adenosine deaminase
MNVIPPSLTGCTFVCARTGHLRSLTAPQRSLAEWFAIFDAVHAVTTSHEAIRRIAREARLGGTAYSPALPWSSCFLPAQSIPSTASAECCPLPLFLPLAQVVEDFAADGVTYLELRTTPKERPEHGITRSSYVQAVLQGLQDAMQDRAPSTSGASSGHTQSTLAAAVTVRLLLSIDRRFDAAAAQNTVRSLRS